MSKPIKSKLDPYAEELFEWLVVEKCKLAEAQARLKEKYNLHISSGRLSGWLENQQQARLQDRLLASVTTGARFVSDVEKRFGDSPPPELNSVMKLVRVLVLELAVRGQAQPELLTLVNNLIGRCLQYESHATTVAQAALDREKFEFLKLKYEQAQATVAEPSITEEERAARIREIFKKI